MATTQRHTGNDEKSDAMIAAVRAEAEERAHDTVAPDGVYDAIGAVNLYVEAFLAGARFAAAQRSRSAVTRR